MDAVMYLIFLLPVALCQSHNVSEECKTDSCVSEVFCLFQERIENMQNELYATRDQLQEKEKELQDTKNQLRGCREQEINESQTTTESISELTTYGPTHKTPEVTVDYSTLHQYNFHARERVRVWGYAVRLRVQGSEVWCTTSSTLYVYSQSLWLMRSVRLEGVTSAHAVTPLPSGRLVVAEWDGGLHILYPNGSRVQSLHTEGRFEDVVSVKGAIHALRDRYPTNDNSTVFSYSLTRGELQASGNITLPHNAQRLSIFNDTVYLTDWMGTDRLYQYNMSGQLLGHHGQESKDASQPGVLRIPYLCSSDQQGNVLVADRNNFRLQVWSPRDDRWTVTRLARHSGWPRDAVVNEDATAMWVMEVEDESPYRYHIRRYIKL